MRKVFVIGDVPTWATASAVETAVRGFLEARDDAPYFRVFVVRNRINVSQLPDHVAHELRDWYSEMLQSGKLPT